MRGEQYLTKPEQYAAVHEKGTSWANRLIVVRALPSGQEISRFGLSVSSKVGGAVVRNKVKRRLREIMRQTDLLPGWDIVFIARPAVAGADYPDIRQSVQNLLAKAKLMAVKQPENNSEHNENTGTGAN